MPIDYLENFANLSLNLHHYYSDSRSLGSGEMDKCVGAKNSVQWAKSALYYISK